jgi:O-antigen/teichoic acid export membrane protein
LNGDPLTGDESSPLQPGLKTKITRGVFTSFLYQPFSIAVAVASVFLIARLIPPHEFGLFVMVNLVLQALAGLAANAVARHALFMPSDSEPRWNLYFLLLLAGQSIVFLLCNAIAGLCRLTDAYRDLAPLLHVASIGYLLDVFAELDRVMAQRKLDFARLQFLMLLAETTRVVVVVAFAVMGFGVWALLLGNTLLISIPYLVDLLFFRRWRPIPSEWRGYSKNDLLPPVKFALHFSGANAGNALKQMAEASLFPLAFAAAQVGHLSRALGLFSQTAGRAMQGFNDTAAAALPSLTSEPDRLRRGAAAYLKVVGGLLLAAVGFFAFAGPTLSAALYGPKWKEVDPLIVPAALQAAAMLYVGACSTTLLASGLQRANIVLLVVISVGAIPSLVALAGRFSPSAYLWTQALTSAVVALMGLVLCRPVVGLRRSAADLLPAAVAASIASLACYGVERLLADESKWLRIALDVLAFSAVHLIVLRAAFPQWLRESLSLVPRGETLSRRLRL